MARRESGFTLIELLVVILVIAILAAIAIPVFVSQREKGWQAQIQSALKHAATAVESYAIDNNGDYSGLDGYRAEDDNGALLAAYGLPWNEYLDDPLSGYLRIEGNGQRFCIVARHGYLTGNTGWRRATYDSTNGEPRPVPDACPNL